LRDPPKCAWKLVCLGYIFPSVSQALRHTLAYLLGPLSEVLCVLCMS
jgi:hypothetical protein